jgi:hypothetical protein
VAVCLAGLTGLAWLTMAPLAQAQVMLGKPQESPPGHSVVPPIACEPSGSPSKNLPAARVHSAKNLPAARVHAPPLADLPAKGNGMADDAEELPPLTPPDMEPESLDDAETPAPADPCIVWPFFRVSGQ